MGKQNRRDDVTKRLFSRVISLTVTAVMCATASSVSLAAKAADLKSEVSISSTDAYIISEEIALRDEFTKTYLLSDGSYETVSSAVALHTYDETTGKWEEIDNSLNKIGTSYENEASDLIVSLPEAIDEDFGATVENKGYEITITPMDANRSDGVLSNPQTEDLSDVSDDEKQNLSTDDYVKNAVSSSSVTYEEAFDNANVEYKLIGNSLKENIVINETPAEGTSYRYEIKTDGLTAVLNDDSSVELFTSDSEQVFYLPAPNMTDANYVFSRDIETSLTEKASGEYILTYTPSAEWLNDEQRTYPVVLDPTVQTKNYTRRITDTYVVNQSDGSYYDSADLLTGATNNGGVDFKSLIKFGSIAPVNKAVITGAYLNLSLKSATSVDNISAYMALEDWDQQTVSYNNLPQTQTEPIDTVAPENKTTLDITGAYKAWVNGTSQNFGLVLDSEATEMCIFNSSESSDAESVPYLSVTYVIGMTNNSDSSESFDAGRAGSIVINKATGNLTLSRNDIGYDGKTMPVNIAMEYSAVNRNDRIIPQSDGYVYGVGTKPSFAENLSCIASSESYNYTLADGSVITFKKTVTTDDEGNEIIEYIDNDYTGYLLEVPDESTAVTDVKVIDLNGYSRYFDAKGRLVKIQDDELEAVKTNVQTSSGTPAGAIVISYSNEADYRVYGVIDCVYDGAGRKYKFVYADNLLSEIEYYGTGDSVIESVCYQYNDNGTLKEVTYPDGNKVRYLWQGYLLTQVKDTLNRRYEFTYTEDNNPKVKTVEQYGSNSAEGKDFSYSYSVGDASQYNDNGEVVQARAFITTVTDNRKNTSETLKYDMTGSLIYEPEENTSQTEEETSEEEPTEPTEEPVDDDLVEPITDAYGRVTSRTNENGSQDSYSYDAFGNTTSQSLSFGGKSISSSDSFTAYGNYDLSSTDSLGNTVTYNYDTDTGDLSSLTDANGNTVNYSYRNGKLVTARQNVSGIGNVQTTYSYDSENNITGISRNGNTYGFAYGPFGELISIALGDTNLVSYTYNSDGNTQSISYANGQNISYAYNPDGNVTEISCGDEVVYRFTYSADGELSSIEDLTSGLTATYTTDSENHAVTQISDENGVYQSYYYDDGNVYETVNGASHNTLYSSEDGKNTTSIQFIDCKKMFEEYSDAFGRKSTETVKSINNSDEQTAIFSKGYSYTTNATDPSKTSEQVSNINIAGDGYQKSISYAYDANGNITAAGDMRYLYDESGQLKMEINNSTGNGWQYTYDAGGNILAKIKVVQGVPKQTNTATYTYGNNSWKDLLTAYNGNEITYDAAGNPITYYNGFNFEWTMGRQLSSVQRSGAGPVNFTYNSDGLRTSKTVAGNTVRYTWIGDKITSEVGNGNALYFYYDSNNTPVAVMLNGTLYYYVTNLQGDIIAMLDETGTAVVEYSYDAWGNTEITGTLKNTVGRINPLRYRGYYYDTDIGLYYLQSRYYDANIGRFINADEPTLLLAGVSNFFGYCKNNPVNNIDYSGYLSFKTAVNSLINAFSSYYIGKAIATYFKLSGWKYYLCVGAVTALTYVISWFPAVEIYNAIKAAIAATASVYLSNKGYTLSREMFFHGLYGYGTALPRKTMLLLISKMKSSNEVIGPIRREISYAESIGLTRLAGLWRKKNFRTGDLYYSIQHAWYRVMGHKRKNGHWYVTITLKDTYNFDNWRPIFKNGFSFANTAYDLGYVLQKTGLLFEYEIQVSFAMEF